MKRYLLPLFLYIVIALTIPIFTEKGEISPFFNGHWFVHTPHTFKDFGLVITALDAQELQTPTFLEFLYASEFKKSWAFAGYNLTQSLGDSYKTQQTQKVEQYLKVLQSQIFNGRQVEFELVEREFDSLDFLNTQKVSKRTILKKISMAAE